MQEVGRNRRSQRDADGPGIGVRRRVDGHGLGGWIEAGLDEAAHRLLNDAFRDIAETELARPGHHGAIDNGLHLRALIAGRGEIEGRACRGHDADEREAEAHGQRAPLVACKRGPTHRPSHSAASGHDALLLQYIRRLKSGHHRWRAAKMA